MKNMLKLLSISLLISASAAALAAPEFAIRNAKRPGAKAMHCPAQGETPDGCTFHAQTNSVNRARLPLAPGARWSTQAQHPALVSIRQAGEETAADGARYQLIDIVAIEPEDADISVTFDRLTATPVKVIERRRVSIMKHSEHSWNEH